MVVDLILPEDKRGTYDKVEKLRDPSHVKTLSLEKLKEFVEQVPLEEIEIDSYHWCMDLETLLKSSFSNQKEKETLKTHFEKDVGKDRLGLGVYREDNTIRFAYPIVILKGVKTGKDP